MEKEEIPTESEDVEEEVELEIAANPELDESLNVSIETSGSI